MKTKIATIKILDEINIAVIGLTQDEYKVMSNMFSVYAKGYVFHPLYKLKKWDGKIRYFTSAGGTYLNLLKEMVPELKKMGYTIKYIDKRAYHSVEIPKIDEFYLEDWGITLGSHQVGAVNAVAEHGNGMLIAGTGAGKAQPLYSKILTPSGWIPNGTLSVGDLVKTPCNSDAAILGIFPQGQTDTYRFRFDDGTTVDASDNHLWNVWLSEKEGFDIANVSKKRQVKREFTFSTVELIRYIEGVKKIGADKTISIRACSPLEFGDDHSVTLDPYLLGALIGDGCLRRQVAVSSADPEILARIESALPMPGTYAMVHTGNYDYAIRKISGRFGKKNNTIKEELVKLGLFGKYSYEKFIPQQYKNASLLSRFELARGLVDTDGYVDSQGRISFSTTSQTLANDFAELVRSLGAIASVKTKETTYTYKGERKTGRTSYTVSFSSSDNSKFTHLTRKKERCRLSVRSVQQLNKNVTGIDYIGKVETQCIYIDHPTHLYVTDGFTATHNTFITAILCDLYERVCGLKIIVIVPNTDLIGQTAEELRSVDLVVGTYSGASKSLEENIIVSTWQALQNNPMIMSQFQAVIVDECHGTTGKVLQQILNTSGAHIPVRIGMTGTLPKEPADKMAIRVCLGEVLYEVGAHELIEKGWLAGLAIKMYCLMENMTDKWMKFQQDNPEESKSMTEAEFTEGYLPDYEAETTYLKKQKTRTTFVADFVENIRQQEKGNTFILVKSVPYGKALSKLIEGAVFVYGQDKTAVRKQIYNLFDTHDNIVVISTFQLASTGLNIKRIFNLVFVDAGKSFTKIIQAIGRGLRKARDKDFVNVYDFYSNLKYSKKHAATRKSFYREQKYNHTVKKVDYEAYYK